MKNDRQKLLLQIIQMKDINTQEDLVRELRARGHKVTQATVSRDIKELQLMKVAADGGGYRYAEPEKREISITERMMRILSDSMVSADHAGNLVVMKTLSGSANVAAEAIDTLDWPEILGTIAGDNTVLIVVRDAECAGETAERIIRFSDGTERE